MLFSWSLLCEIDVSQSNFTISVTFNTNININMRSRHLDLIIYVFLLVERVAPVLLRLENVLRLLTVKINKGILLSLKIYCHRGLFRTLSNI